jgi:hypothetical protein
VEGYEALKRVWGVGESILVARLEARLRERVGDRALWVKMPREAQAEAQAWGAAAVGAIPEKDLRPFDLLWQVIDRLDHTVTREVLFPRHTVGYDGRGVRRQVEVLSGESYGVEIGIGLGDEMGCLSRLELTNHTREEQRYFIDFGLSPEHELTAYVEDQHTGSRKCWLRSRLG